jgi:hypothetical protein
MTGGNRIRKLLTVCQKLNYELEDYCCFVRNSKAMTTLGKGMLWAIFGIVIPIVFLFWTEEENFRNAHPAYATGQVMAFGTAGRSGAAYAQYTFEVAGKTYSGWAPKENCKDCVVGSQVKIIYAEGNPRNSNLIK